MSLMTVANLESYFHDALRRATQVRATPVNDATHHYLVNLLVGFSRAERLYENIAGKRELKPLALMFADALEADPGTERNILLRRLGDIALFLSGFFSDSFARKIVDVDYYHRMGETAYSTLSDSPASRRDFALRDVFEELAAKFLPVTDAIADIANEARIFDERDLLRLYEVWVRTGSPRAADLLRKLGIEPVEGMASRKWH